MNIELKKGMVVNLSEEENKKYVIIEILEKQNNKYMLLTDFEGNIDAMNGVIHNIKMDFSKMFMVSYDKSKNEFLYDTDETIMKELVDKAMQANL